MGIIFNCPACRERVPTSDCTHTDPTEDQSNWTIVCRCGHAQRAFPETEEAVA